MNPNDKNFEPPQEILDLLPGFIYQIKLNPQGEFSWLYISKGVERLLGVSVAEAMQNVDSVLSLIHPEDAERVISESIAKGEKLEPWFGEFRMHSVDGREMYFEAHDTPQKMPDGDIIFTGYANDVTEKHELERRLNQMSRQDNLTGLMNRNTFHEVVDNTIRLAQRRNQRFALLFIDLDRFKPVNDIHGHGVGDLLLKEVGQRITQCLRASDTPCRYGGDEFLVLLPDTHLEEDIVLVAKKIIWQIEQPFMLEGHEIHISASIGISSFPDQGQSADSLCNHADLAMYAAKKEEHGNVRFYKG